MSVTPSRANSILDEVLVERAEPNTVSLPSKAAATGRLAAAKQHARMIVNFDGGVVDFESPGPEHIRWAKSVWESDATEPTISVAGIEHKVTKIRYVAKGGLIDWEWTIADGRDL